MKSYVYIPIVISLLLVTVPVSCKKSSEKALEYSIERESGQKADVDISEERVQIKTEEGTAEWGMKVEIPADFPSDIPIYPKSQPTMSMSGEEGDSIMITLLTGDTPNNVAKFYSTRLKEDGWKIETEMVFGEGKHFAASKGERKCAVIISSDNEAKKTSIMISTDE